MILAALYLALFPCRVLGHRALVGGVSVWGCGLLPAQLSSLVQPGLVLQGNGNAYTLVRCLGAGENGEAWLVQLPGQGPNREAVLKLVETVDEDCVESSVDEDCECNFAKRVKERVGSGDVHITACLDSGKLDTGPAEAGGASPQRANGDEMGRAWRYIVYERANGYMMKEILERAPARRLEVFPSVGQVFLRLKQLHDFMEALAGEDEAGLKLFHLDLHPGNLFITKDYLTAIDFGNHYVCCGEAACANRFFIGKCDGEEQKEVYSTGNIGLLAGYTLGFLFDFASWPGLGHEVLAFAVAEESSGEADYFQERVRQEFREECPRDSVCDQALHSAAHVLRGQAPAVGALTLSEIIERGST